MKNHIGKNVLITTSCWFMAPNGLQYCSVWGKLKAVHESGKTLGFIPNRSHANWFIEIGGMIIMGCQVMYFIRCDKKPKIGKTRDHKEDAGKVVYYDRPTKIYISK